MGIVAIALSLLSAIGISLFIILGGMSKIIFICSTIFAILGITAGILGKGGKYCKIALIIGIIDILTIIFLFLYLILSV